MTLRIRKADFVEIISGKDKGKRGRILKVFPGENRVIVEGANLVKKHLRKRSEEERGGIIETPAPLHISNVALVCKSCDRGVRFSVRVLEDGTKIRVCLRCKNQI